MKLQQNSTFFLISCLFISTCSSYPQTNDENKLIQQINSFKNQQNTTEAIISNTQQTLPKLIQNLGLVLDYHTSQTQQYKNASDSLIVAKQILTNAMSKTQNAAMDLNDTNSAFISSKKTYDDSILNLKDAQETEAKLTDNANKVAAATNATSDQIVNAAIELVTVISAGTAHQNQLASQKNIIEDLKREFVTGSINQTPQHITQIPTTSIPASVSNSPGSTPLTQPKTATNLSSSLVSTPSLIKPTPSSTPTLSDTKSPIPTSNLKTTAPSKGLWY